MAYKSDYDNYKADLKQYKQHKAKVFLLLMGQCMTNMKRKVECNEDFDDIEEDYDVVRLIDLLRRLSYAEEDAKYKYWTVANDLMKLSEMRHRNDESLNTYYTRFKNMIRVIESRWGPLVPTKAAEGESNYKRKEEDAKKNAREKMLACLFLAGIDQTRYGRCIDELSNSSMGGNTDKYPKTVKDAMDYASEFTDSGMRKHQKRGIVMANLADKICYTCGEKGHISSGCPKNKQKETTAMNAAQLDEDTSTALALPNAPRPP